MSERIQVGDVVQLSPDAVSNRMFGGCMLLVTEVKPWGVQGFVQTLGSHGKMGDRAYYRANFSEFEYVWKAVWIPGEAKGE